MKALIFLISILLVSNANAQLKQRMADRQFEYHNYAKCVEMYDELAEDCYRNKKNANWDNTSKAAICHFNLFEMEKAVYHFRKRLAKNIITEDERVKCIHALRYLGKYGEANDLIKESAYLFPNGSYFRRLDDQRSYFSELFLDSMYYDIRPTEINSGLGDFSATYWGNSVVYVTKSKNRAFGSRHYGWDDDFYLSIMESKLNPDSTLAEPRIMKHQFLSSTHDGPVAFSNDGKRMVITKNHRENHKGKEFVVLSLYFSEFIDGDWTDLEPFEHNNADYNVGHGVFSTDGKRLYFASDMPGGQGGVDIYYCDRTTRGWSKPQNLGKEINTELDEMFPFEQNGTLYFASNGHFGLGGLDIFSVSLNDFITIDNVGYPVNSSADDFALIYDKQGRLGYFSTNRDDNIDRIYKVKYTPITIDLVCNVFHKYKELEPVGNQPVYIKRASTQKIDTVMTDAAYGTLKYELKANEDYQIFTKEDEFILLNEEKRSTQGIRRDSTLVCDLLLKPTTIQIHLRVVEKESRKIIPQATAIVTDYSIGWDTTMVTNDQGMVTLTVDRNKVFWAHGAKKGFIDADISFNSTNENDRVIDLELALPPIKKGEKFKLENIFYDLNKWTLRQKSQRSLDKLADFLLKNDLKIELSAHTDSRGSDRYNQTLSQRRAQSCVDYLISKGVPKANIKARGYGETQLVNRCKNGVQCSEEEHQENRRTEVKILEVN